MAVMSGHLVQRGEPALFSKWSRAEAALRNGVDLVLELPSLFAACSAEMFADAAVGLLEGTGCIDWLGFGSECGRLAPLWKAAQACTDEAVNGFIRQELKVGNPLCGCTPEGGGAAGGPGGCRRTYRAQQHPRRGVFEGTATQEFVHSAMLTTGRQEAPMMGESPPGNLPARRPSVGC